MTWHYLLHPSAPVVDRRTIFTIASCARERCRLLCSVCLHLFVRRNAPLQYFTIYMNCKVPEIPPPPPPPPFKKTQKWLMFKRLYLRNRERFFFHNQVWVPFAMLDKFKETLLLRRCACLNMSLYFILFLFLCWRGVFWVLYGRCGECP